MTTKSGKAGEAEGRPLGMWPVVRQPPGAWNVPLTILAAIGGFAIFFGAAIIYGIFAVLAGQIDPSHPMARMDPLLIAQLVAYFPVAIYFVAILPQLARVPLVELGFRAPTARDIGIALLGTLAMYAAVSGLGLAAAYVTHRHDTETAVTLLKSLSTPGERIALVLMATVIAPMVEELAFRVFLFNAFSRYVTIPIAAILSGLTFGAAHMQGPQTFVTFALPLGAGGMVLAYVYAQTRCYWSSVITHGTFNAIAVIGIIFFHAS